MTNIISLSIKELCLDSINIFVDVLNQLKELDTQRLTEWNKFAREYPSVANMQDVKDKWLMNHRELQSDEEIEILFNLLNIKEAPIEGAMSVDVDVEALMIHWYLD